jgi:hypothetical protein
MVRITGLEPVRLAALPPQSSVSANSTISALVLTMKQPVPPRARGFLKVTRRILIEDLQPAAPERWLRGVETLAALFAKVNL